MSRGLNGLMAALLALTASIADTQQARARQAAIIVLDGLGSHEQSAHARAKVLFSAFQGAGVTFTPAAPILRAQPQPAPSRNTPGSTNEAREPVREVTARQEAAHDVLAGRTDAALVPDYAFVRQSSLFNAMRIPFVLRSATEHENLLFQARPLWNDLFAEHGLVLLAILPMHPVARIDFSPGPQPDSATSFVDAGIRRLSELWHRQTSPVGSSARQSDEFYAIAWSDLQASHAPTTRGIIAFWPVAFLVMRKDLFAEMSAEKQARIFEIATWHEDRWHREDLAASAAVWQATRTVLDPPERNTTPLRDLGLQLAGEWMSDAGADGRALAASQGWLEQDKRTGPPATVKTNEHEDR